jgi:hypothetical protein
MDPLAKAYLKVITESDDLQNTKSQKVEGSSQAEGEIFGDKKNDIVKKVQKGTGPEAEGAETLEKAEEADCNLSVGGDNDGKVKKFPSKYEESSNPFDNLFNKLISEEGEMMDFSTGGDDKPEDSTFEPSFGNEEESDEFGEDEDEEGDEVTFTLDRETAKKLHEVLSGVLDEAGEEDEGEDYEGGEESDEFGEDEDEEESSAEGAKPFGEAVEAEEEGHALVDAEKLSHGLTKKGSYTVKGAVPVTKKTAQTPATGKGHDGKLKPHSTESGVSALQSKQQNVGGVKVGKTLFDND